MNLREKAQQLASRPYVVAVRLEETTDNEPTYVARSPELEGCIAQGETVEEAVKNLQEARVDYIESLLEDGLPVPAPYHLATTTTTAFESVTFEATYSRKDDSTRKLTLDPIYPSKRESNELVLSS